LNRLSRVHERYRRQTTDDRQTDGRATAYSEREREFTFAKNKTKNSSGDEIANVYFYAMRPEATEFAEITQNNCHYAVQGHSRSPILVPIESSYAISY